MPATDPRLATGFDEQDAHFQTFAGDASITPPAFTVPGLTNSPSAQQGLAVANVATGTGTPLAGLGVVTNPLLGKVKTVDVDGTVTVQDRGYMTLPYVVGTAPVIGGAVDVDGTGKVQASATFRGSRCEGYMVDPNTGLTVCIVKRF